MVAVRGDRSDAMVRPLPPQDPRHPRRERAPLRARLRRRWPELTVLVFSLAVIAVAYWHFNDLDLTLRYADGRAKLNMARRIFDSPTPGFGQIGGVWLPLPVLVMALTAWITPLYTSGLSGSLVAMLAFGVTCVMLFAIGRRLAGTLGGLCGVALFAANPHILYLYTTPMTEPLLISAIVALTLALMRFEEQPRHIARLTELAAAALLCTLIRYEGWLLLGATTGYVALILWRAGATRVEIQARVVAFLALAAQGVVLWLVWETMIFGNPLYFATSKYSAHVIDVLYYGYTENVGDIARSVQTYLAAVHLSFPRWSLLLAALGLGVLGLRIWRSAGRWVAASLLLAIPAFFVLSLFRGQAAIYLARDADDLHYNIRYGLVSAPLIAVFGGLGVAALLGRLPGRGGVLGWLVPGALAAALLLPSWERLITGNLEFLRDRGAQHSRERTATAAWLREHYDGGRVLMEVFKNNDLVFHAQIPQRRYVTEGNVELWKRALEHPETVVRWVFMSGRKDDVVRARLGENPDFHRYFERAHHTAAPDPAIQADIFRLRDVPLTCRPIVSGERMGQCATE